jgi:uncharacterized membrane protein YjjP (DUF1212 family)
VEPEQPDQSSSLNRSPKLLPSQNPADVLEVAAEAGAHLLAAGGEVSRVEDTMRRIAVGLGLDADTVEAAVFPTVLFLSAAGATLMRRVRQRSVNLAVVARVNQLSRDLSEQRIDLGAFRQQLDDVRKLRRYRSWHTIVVAALAGGLLCQLMGGRWFDFFPAMLSGALAHAVRQRQGPLNGSLKDFLAAVAAVFPGLAAAQWPFFHPGTIIVGGIMVLVPGMAMTSAIRDGIAGDVVSAVARMLEALLTAAAVAAGVALPLNLYLALGGRWP